MKKLLFVFGFLGLLLNACTKEKEVVRPNIVMIAIDDMNNWVGAWGGQAHTPAIDKLASEGIQFEHAYCVVPACNPSRAALLTGQRPETTGQYYNDGNFRHRVGGADRITLPQYLSSLGYETVAAGKIFHHARGAAEEPRELSDTISWDYQWVGNPGTPGANLYQTPNKKAAWHDGELDDLGYAGTVLWGEIPQSKEECGDWKLADFCANYLQKEHDKPFMLACGIFRPHSPHLAPKEYFDKYPIDEIEMPAFPAPDMVDIPEIAQSNWSTPLFKKMVEKGEWKKAVQSYLACMSFADDCVNHVLSSLENSAYKDNTIVIFWTDHGWQLGHKYRWEKFALWKQATNSPMIIKLPGKDFQPATCKRQVSYLDIYPTVVDLLGEEMPSYLDGNSLVPLINDPEMEWNIPAIITYPRGNHSVVLNDWNYIHYEDGSEELYYHIEDPTEFTNLAGKPEYRELMDSLKKFIPQNAVEGDVFVD